MITCSALISSLVISCAWGARLGDAPTQNVGSAIQDKMSMLQLLQSPPLNTGSTNEVEEGTEHTKEIGRSNFAEQSDATLEDTTSDKSTLKPTTKESDVILSSVTTTLAPAPVIPAKVRDEPKKMGVSTLASLAVKRNCEGSENSQEQAILSNVKVVFINDDRHIARRDCVEKQLERQCLNAARFPAVTFDRSPNEILSDPGNRACAAKGVDQLQAVKSGRLSLSVGQTSGNARKVGEILAEWCSYYRLMDIVNKDYMAMTENQNASEATDGHYDYVLMLDDSVVMSETAFAPVIKDFIQNFTVKQWDIVQFDAVVPQGKEPPHVDSALLDDRFRDKMVFMPNLSSDYFGGLQAVLVKAKSLPQILEMMTSMKGVPMDVLFKEVNMNHFGLKALTYQAGITRSMKYEAKDPHHKHKAPPTLLHPHRKHPTTTPSPQLEALAPALIQQPTYCIDLEL